MRQVVSSSVNPMQEKSYHDVEEFSDVGPSSWCRMEKTATTKTIFKKMHSGENVLESEKQ